MTWFEALTQVLTMPVQPSGYVVTWLAFPIVTVAYLALASHFRIVRYKYRRVMSVMFNWRFFAHRSHMFDVLMTIGNTSVFVLLFGWAVLSVNTIASLTASGLSAVFGAPAATAIDPAAAAIISGIVLILVYEFGYWLDHYLAHTVPFLWEFHKVHHTAEVLSPLTVFRVHPIDSVVFYNILALTSGPTLGVLRYIFADAPLGHSILNQGTYVIIAMHLAGYWQHSHVWIPFTGIVGRIFMSPAHHQIHHSASEVHYDKNLGSFLAIYDWLFSTLHMPSRRREKLVFGVKGATSDAHTLQGGLVMPVVDAIGHLRPRPPVAIKATDRT